MDTAQKILNLIAPYVKEGTILPRNYAEIKSRLDEFIILKNGEKIIACAGFKIYPNGFSEIYALAVLKSEKGRGISKKLLDKIFEKAKNKNIKKIFALSKYGEKWFLKNGFKFGNLKDLPAERKATFDISRNPNIFIIDVI